MRTLIALLVCVGGLALGLTGLWVFSGYQSVNTAATDLDATEPDTPQLADASPSTPATPTPAQPEPQTRPDPQPDSKPKPNTGSITQPTPAPPPPDQARNTDPGQQITGGDELSLVSPSDPTQAPAPADATPGPGNPDQPPLPEHTEILPMDPGQPTPAPAPADTDAAASTTKADEQPDAANAKPRLAVIPFQLVGEFADDEQALGRVIQARLARLVNTPTWSVVERNRIRDVLNEQDFQLSDMTAGGDATARQKFGGLVGATHLLLGDVTRFRGQTTIGAQIVSVDTGEVAAAGQTRVDDLKWLDIALKDLVNTLGLTRKTDERWQPRQPENPSAQSRQRPASPRTGPPNNGPAPTPPEAARPDTAPRDQDQGDNDRTATARLPRDATPSTPAKDPTTPVTSPVDDLELPTDSPYQALQQLYHRISTQRLPSPDNPFDRPADQPAAEVPDSPARLAVLQWGHHNRVGPVDTGLLDLPPDALTGLELPLIGLVDTGLNHRDPRLSPAVARNFPETPANRRDDDANGLVDDTYGYHFALARPDVTPPGNRFGHGTFVGSILVGQRTGKPFDVPGLLPNAKLVVAGAVRRGQDPASLLSEDDLPRFLRAVEYAADRGARVINISLGLDVDARTLERLNQHPLWDRLEREDVILVCAAGNHGHNIDKAPVFPASLPRNNIITVMGLGPDGKLARRRDPDGSLPLATNVGPRDVDIAAPGALILGIHAPGHAELRSGTSYAVPFVTAAVALVQAHRPRWTAPRVIQTVLDTAKTVPGLSGRCRSAGIVHFANLHQRLTQS